MLRLATVRRHQVNNSAEVTLTTCDVEPIHLLSAIQPFGFLLAINTEWFIVRASDNTEAHLGIAHDAVIGRPLAELISLETLHDIRGCLQLIASGNNVECVFEKRLIVGGRLFDIAVHQTGGEVIVEFEPSQGEAKLPLSRLRGMVARIERQETQKGLFREVARQVRALSGFDRVMVYRFDEDHAGEVVGEALDGGLSPFLGLRYPATDIPVQARALYEKSYVRIIADIDAEPAQVLPARSPEGQPLDLSMSVLRSVSPIHLEYLRNMGVRASMSISIMQKGKLWGLIACHHNTPKRLSLETRFISELFGRMFSNVLELRHRDEDAAHDLLAVDIQNRVAFAFADPGTSMRNIPEFLAGVSDFIAGDGIGSYIAGEITLTGVTPTREEFLQLIKFLNQTAAARVFATHCLSDTYPPALDFVMRAAGILSIPISRTPRDYLVFFRREAVHTVTWGGEPKKIESFGPNGSRLTPRKSFEAWQESVHRQSERWHRRELRAAEALRITLVELVLRMVESAAAAQIGSQQHQEILIAELNHRVRNILGLVRGLVTQSAAVAESTSVFVQNLDDRIRSLARSHDLLTSTSWKPVSLHALLQAEVVTYGDLSKRLSLVGPDVLLQPKAFTALALLVHELVTNARKHGAFKTSQGSVILETFETEIGNVHISWRETGGPTVVPPTRRGFGSTLLEQLVPFELTGTSQPKFHAEGFVLDLMLPASFATCAHGASDTVTLKANVNDNAVKQNFRSLLRNVLVVDDNLFIAIDAEDMLRELGAENILIAGSLPEALATLKLHTFSFAVLDMNLGTDNSLPIAHALHDTNVPFIFATGYGDSVSVPPVMAAIPILSKPYNRPAFASILQGMGPADEPSEAAAE